MSPRPHVFALIFTVLLPFTLPVHAEQSDPDSDELSILAAAPVDTLPIARAALLIAQGVEPGVDVDAYLRQVDLLAREVGETLDQIEAPEARLEALARQIYDVWGFAQASEVPASAYVGFHEVLEKRQWNCFGMAVLYLALAERLDLPLRMVSGRGHVFLEYDGDPALYVETTDGGRVHASKTYIEDYLPFPCVREDEFQSVDSKQAVAVVLSQTALAAQHAGSFPLARTYFERSLGFDPGNAEAHAGLGFLHASAGNFEAALAAFQQALEHDSAFREAHGGIGNVRYAQGDMKEALKAFRQAVALCPEEPAAVFNLAQLHLETGEAVAAVEGFERYIALVPEDMDGPMRLGRAHEALDDVASALTAYRQAARVNPNSAAPQLDIAYLLEQQDDFAGAASAYEAALEIDASAALAWGGLGRVRGAQGDTSGAREALERALRLAPGNSVLWVDYGHFLRGVGEAEAALDSYRRALQLDPGDSEALLAAAEVLLEAGDEAQARQFAAQARDQGATLPDAISALLGDEAEHKPE